VNIGVRGCTLPLPYYVTEHEVGCDALGVMNVEAGVADFDTLKQN